MLENHNYDMKISYKLSLKAHFHSWSWKQQPDKKKYCCFQSFQPQCVTFFSRWSCSVVMEMDEAWSDTEVNIKPCSVDVAKDVLVIDLLLLCCCDQQSTKFLSIHDGQDNIIEERLMLSCFLGKFLGGASPAMINRDQIISRFKCDFVPGSFYFFYFKAHCFHILIF